MKRKSKPKPVRLDKVTAKIKYESYDLEMRKVREWMRKEFGA